jgi:hypothetical protein
MRNLAARIDRLEKAEGARKAKIHSVHFVGTPEEARPGEANAPKGLWGSGKGAWHVYKAPGQAESEALRAAGIDTSKDKVIIWTLGGTDFSEPRR